MRRVDRRAVAVAGHTGDVDSVREAIGDPDPQVRATALGALDRLGELPAHTLVDAVADPSAVVRRRAAALAATRADVDLTPMLSDVDPSVVEVAAWACGEQSEHHRVPDATIDVLRALTTGDGPGSEPLVRESAVAALGAIGDRRALAEILTATTDKPAIRRRAVLALAPFLDGPSGEPDPDVSAALDRALTDRDWQVRQAAEDLRA